MKKTISSSLLLPVILLTGCNNTSNRLNVSSTITEFIPSCSSSRAETVLVCTENSSSVMPFDAGISLNLYGDDYDNQNIKDQFIKDMSYYGALFDRHNDYRYRLDTSTPYVSFSNVKTINDAINTLNESSDNSISIKLEKELYDGLKIAINFSIDSELENSMRYNLSVGRISSLYDEKISQAQNLAYQSHLNDLSKTDDDINKLVILRDTNLVVVHEDFTEDEFEKAKLATLSKEELQNMFSFNDETNTITINKIKTYEEGYTPQLTLGGYGKGYAEKIFSDKFKDTALLLNGGSSSIMTQNVKTNGNNWTIRIDNPLYREETAYTASMTGLGIALSNINPSEFYFESETSFVLSTSGYYNNYFYTMDKNGNTVLRHHIIDGLTGNSPTFFDSVSIMINDPGYADMYSTALLNCSSLVEAENLRKKLDEKYNFNTWAFYTTHDKLNFNKTKVTAYIPTDHVSMFSLMTTDDVSNLYPLITEIQTF